MGNDRFAVVNVFKGKLQIQLRQYEKDGKDRLFPTKSGICLSPPRFAALMFFSNLINLQLDKIRRREFSFRLHLGGGTFLSANVGFPVIHVRHYFLPEGQTSPHPTRKGLALRVTEWEALVSKFEDINMLMDRDNIPCFLRDSHNFSSTANICEECNPFQPFLVPDYGF